MVQVLSVTPNRSVCQKMSDSFWTSITVLISIIDIVLGVAALFLCSFPIRDYKYLQYVLDAVGRKDDMLFWSVVYIPFCASLSVLNGIFQLAQICKKTVYLKFDFIKIFIVLMVELLGFGLPYAFISEYGKKIEIVIDHGQHNQYMILHLLLVNWLTTGIIAYQIVTYLFIAYHNLARMDKKEREESLLKTSNTDAGGSTNLTNCKRNENEDLAGIFKDFPKIEVPPQPQASQ